MRNLKWLFGIFLTVMIVCVNYNYINAEENADDVSDFKYIENSDGTINITACNEREEYVVIPSEIDGKKVKNINLNKHNDRWEDECKIKNLIISEGITNIMNYSFRGCICLETVSLPSTIQTIGKYAFEDCNKLKSINLPEGLTSIGEWAFENCYYLESVVLPNSLTNLGKHAFYQCGYLSKITIPGNLKVIKSFTFYNCINLQEVEIREGVTQIESTSFLCCNKLRKVIIPNSVNNIDSAAFIYYISSGHSLLKEVVIYANSDSYARTYANQNGIKFSCLNNHDWDNGKITVEPTIKNKGQVTYTCTACGIKRTATLATPKKGKIISAYNSQDTYKVTKPGTKNGTVEFAGTNNKEITNISIPNTVTISGITYKITSVAKNAFKNNKQLKNITIGKNVTKINAGAFNGCKNLSVINIKSKKITSVGKNAFKGIKAKAKIKVPSSRLSKYKKIFAGKGQKSTVKIVK